jgi:hypothetical protein
MLFLLSLENAVLFLDKDRGNNPLRLRKRGLWGAKEEIHSGDPDHRIPHKTLPLAVLRWDYTDSGGLLS